MKSAGFESLIGVVDLRRRYLNAVSCDDQTTEYARGPAVTDHDAVRVRVEPKVADIRQMVANVSDTQKKMWMSFVALFKGMLDESDEFETQMVTRVLDSDRAIFTNALDAVAALTEGCRLRHINHRLR